jgi:membrane associated rhomboid family serine protease
MLPLRDTTRIQGRSLASKTLIAANIVVFLYELMLGGNLGYFFRDYGLVQFRVIMLFKGTTPIQPTVMTFFTNIFIHAGFMHLGGNMLFLWVFGRRLESRIGPWRLLAFYLAGGLAANLLQLIFTFLSASGASFATASSAPIIGASGAVAAILGSYLILFPKARILTLVIIPFFITSLRLPAGFVLSWWFIIQLFNGLLSLGTYSSGGGVAWFAHIGGFLLGIYYARRANKRRRFNATIS